MFPHAAARSFTSSCSSDDSDSRGPRECLRCLIHNIEAGPSNDSYGSQYTFTRSFLPKESCSCSGESTEQTRYPDFNGEGTNVLFCKPLTTTSDEEEDRSPASKRRGVGVRGKIRKKRRVTRNASAAKYTERIVGNITPEPDWNRYLHGSPIESETAKCPSSQRCYPEPSAYNGLKSRCNSRSPQKTIDEPRKEKPPESHELANVRVDQQRLETDSCSALTSKIPAWLHQRGKEDILAYFTTNDSHVQKNLLQYINKVIKPSTRTASFDSVAKKSENLSKSPGTCENSEARKEVLVSAKSPIHLEGDSRKKTVSFALSPSQTKLEDEKTIKRSARLEKFPGKQANVESNTPAQKRALGRERRVPSVKDVRRNQTTNKIVDELSKVQVSRPKTHEAGLTSCSDIQTVDKASNSKNVGKSRVKNRPQSTSVHVHETVKAGIEKVDRCPNLKSLEKRRNIIRNKLMRSAAAGASKEMPIGEDDHFQDQVLAVLNGLPVDCAVDGVTEEMNRRNTHDQYTALLMKSTSATPESTNGRQFSHPVSDSDERNAVVQRKEQQSSLHKQISKYSYKQNGFLELPPPVRAHSTLRPNTRLAKTPSPWIMKPCSLTLAGRLASQAKPWSAHVVTREAPRRIITIHKDEVPSGFVVEKRHWRRPQEPKSRIYNCKPR